jgi:asparagine N-glycosylation enzyme membrane subunit Stt3
MGSDGNIPPHSFFKGPASLVIVVVIVAGLLIFLPAYRWIFAISVGIGIIFAVAIYLWHKFNPIREPEPDNKRPLGLG